MEEEKRIVATETPEEALQNFKKAQPVKRVGKEEECFSPQPETTEETVYFNLKEAASLKHGDSLEILEELQKRVSKLKVKVSKIEEEEILRKSRLLREIVDGITAMKLGEPILPESVVIDTEIEKFTKIYWDIQIELLKKYEKLVNLI